MIYQFTVKGEILYSETRIILTEDVVSKLGLFKKEVKHIKTFAFEGDIVFWVNERGNFKISHRQDDFWDVYWGLHYKPNRIRDDVKYLEELMVLYSILVTKN